MKKKINNPENIIIVGAGGVARWSMFPLLTMLKYEGSNPVTIKVFDEDLFEEHNLDRQISDPDAVGKHKAEYLAKEWEFLLQRPGGNDVTIDPVVQWFTSTTEIDDGSHIFCFADNNPAWTDTLAMCDCFNSHGFRGANETDYAQGIYYNPSFRDGDRDPRVLWPEILEDKSGSPVGNCTGAEQEAAPQTALANQTAAVLTMKLARNVWGSDGYDIGASPSFYDEAGSFTDNRAKVDNLSI